jgi:hypothetical protein
LRRTAARFLLEFNIKIERSQLCFNSTDPPAL